MQKILNWQMQDLSQRQQLEMQRYDNGRFFQLMRFLRENDNPGAEVAKLNNDDDDSLDDADDNHAKLKQASTYVTTLESSYRMGVAALLGYELLFNVLFTLALAYLEALGKPQAIISKEEAAAVRVMVGKCNR
nr:ABC transporter G family member 35-like [Tanacetum cinerariifolium]GEX96864.1 ABC transporter G family member 35-like [Tanacetum cinerariifolium]